MKILMLLHGSFKGVTYMFFFGVSMGVNEYPIVLQMWFKIFTNNCVQVEGGLKKSIKTVSQFFLVSLMVVPWLSQ